jgi:hypothetical protein
VKYGCEVKIEGKIIVIGEGINENAFTEWVLSLPLRKLLEYTFDDDVETDIEEIWSEKKNKGE